MKLSNFNKLKKQEFNPILHWYFILILNLLAFILILLYSIYTFFDIKMHINSAENDAMSNVVYNSTSTKSNNKFLKNVINLNKSIEKYDQKDVLYSNILLNNLNSIINNNKNSTTTSTSSSGIATSTK